MRRAAILEALAFAPGCAQPHPETTPAPPAVVHTIPESHFRGFTTGMSRGQVEAALGAPIREVGARGCGQGGSVEVREYAAAPEGESSGDDRPRTFFLYFLEGRLEGWSRPGGDWERECDHLCARVSR